HVHEGRRGYDDARVHVQARDPQGRVALTDLDRGIRLAARREREQLVIPLERADVSLLVPGRDTRGVRWGPHLQEMDRLGLARVLFRVADPRARAHALGNSGRDHTLVPFTVAVLQRAL